MINSREGVGQFARGRVSLGGEVAVVGGPVGVGGVVDVGAGRSEKAEDESRQAGTWGEKQAAGGRTSETGAGYGPFDPVFTYVKSRGLFAGIQVDGTVISERREANAAFYGERVSASQIIRGEGGLPARQAPHLWPVAAKSLYDALKRAESRSEEGEEVISLGQARGGAVENEGVGKGMGEGQGQGGQDPVPRQGVEELGGPTGSSAHRTTDELPEYGGAGDTIRGQARGGAVENEGVGKGMGEGQGQGGQDPVPRQGVEELGRPTGSSVHRTTDELPGYGGGAGDSIRGQKTPEIGQAMPDEVPRQSGEKRGTAGGQGAHTASDELPAYPGGKH